MAGRDRSSGLVAGHELANMVAEFVVGAGGNMVKFVYGDRAIVKNFDPKFVYGEAEGGVGETHISLL